MMYAFLRFTKGIYVNNVTDSEGGIWGEGKRHIESRLGVYGSVCGFVGRF